MDGCKWCKDDGDSCTKCGWKVFRGEKHWPKGDRRAELGAGVGTGHPIDWTEVKAGVSSAVGTVTGKAQTMFSKATFSPCDHRALMVIHTLKGEKCLYGAQGAKLADTYAKVDHLDLILDLAGMVRPKRFIVQGPRRYQSLNAWAYPEVVNLHWPDMTAPKGVPLVFWQKLLAQLPHHTAIACIGGHGRTGTCLACLMVADGMDPERAISLVREKHCGKAIESVEQENYIKRLKG